MSSTLFTILTVVFIVVSAAMVLIILVQRPQGGGLAGAFGGAGGGGTDTVFGGRVGDALTYMTVVAFLVYLGLAITLNLLDASGGTVVTEQEVAETADDVGAGDGSTPGNAIPLEAQTGAPISIPGGTLTPVEAPPGFGGENPGRIQQLPEGFTPPTGDQTDEPNSPE